MLQMSCLADVLLNEEGSSIKCEKELPSVMNNENI